MSKKGQALAAYISGNAENVLRSSIQKLSKDTSISTATIVRFCQDIGVDGFSDLKLKLAALLFSKDDNEYDEVEIGESVLSIKNKLATKSKLAIDTTKNGIDENKITKVINAINKSARIFVYGVGASGLVANDIYQKFLRLGKNISCTSDFHIAVSQIGNFEFNDVLILVSNQGKTSEVRDLLEVGIKVGCKTIILTAQPKISTAKKADIILLTQDIGEPKIRSGATTSLISQFFVVDVLVFSYISKYSDQVFESLKQSNRVAIIHKKGKNINIKNS